MFIDIFYSPINLFMCNNRNLKRQQQKCSIDTYTGMIELHCL